MCFLEVARTLAYGSRDGYRVVGILYEDTREKCWEPALDGVRITLDESTDPENSSMTLTDCISVRSIAPIRKTTVFRQAHKTVLQTIHN